MSDRILFRSESLTEAASELDKLLDTIDDVSKQLKRVNMTEGWWSRLSVNTSRGKRSAQSAVYMLIDDTRAMGSYVEQIVDGVDKTKQMFRQADGDVTTLITRVTTGTYYEYGDNANYKDSGKSYNNEKQSATLTTRNEDIAKEELERRKKIANIWNWGVTIGCVVGTIAVVALTGGTALLPMIAASTVTGAFTAATKNLTSQYVEDGFADGVDLNSLGKDVAIGTVTGAVSGAIGAGMGGLTAKVSSKVVTSSNAFARIGTSAVIGAVSEGVEGVARRGTETFIETGGDIETAFDEALDGDEILTDMIVGGIAGGGSEAVKTINKYNNQKVYNQAKIEAKNAAQEKVNEVVQKRNTLEVAEFEKRTGLSKLKQGSNNSIDFSDSDDILRNKDGVPASFKIKATGNLKADEKIVNKKMLEAGFDTNWKQSSRYSMHSVADYDAVTGEYTVQIINAKAKNVMNKYSGTIPSAETQYRLIHGGGYGKAVNSDAAIYKASDVSVPEQTAIDKTLEAINENYTKVADYIDAAYERNVEIDNKL